MCCLAVWRTSEFFKDEHQIFQQRIAFICHDVHVADTRLITFVVLRHYLRPKINRLFHVQDKLRILVLVTPFNNQAEQIHQPPLILNQAIHAALKLYVFCFPLPALRTISRASRQDEYTTYQ